MRSTDTAAGHATELLDDLDPVLERVIARLQGSFPTYASVPAEFLRPSTRRAVESALLCLQSGELPQEDEVESVVDGVRMQARQAVPVDDVVQGFVAGVRELWAVIKERDSGDDPDALIRAAELLWTWDDLVTTQAIVVHRITELDALTREQYRRLSLVNALLEGASATRLRSEAADLGFPVDGECIPFRARQLQGRDPRALEYALLGSADSTASVAAVIDGDIVGIARFEPGPAPDGTYLALGRPGELPDAPEGLATANRTLEAALALRGPGTYRWHELTVESAVVADADTGRALWERYGAPLAGAGPRQARILATVEAYLRDGRDVEACAARLEVHPNTVRYRVRRYEELAGIDFSDAHHLVGVWWALTHRASREAVATL